jgi:uncharacterized metal-binding protein
MSTHALTPAPSLRPAPAAGGVDAYAGKPLIYACSGCSSAAQLANHLALRMDRAARAEMSCIVGLGGDVAPLVRTAKSGRPIVMLDGCPLHCGLHTLARHGLTPDLHWDLWRFGVRKEKHVDFDPADAARLEPVLSEALAKIDSATASEIPLSPR